MKRNDSRTQTRQDKIEGERPRIREAAEPSLDPPHAAEVAALETGETTFQPQVARHVALLSLASFDAQRTNIVLHLQRTYGNSYVQRLLRSMSIQAKMTVSAPGDIYEQEADSVAEKVVRGLNSQVQRQEEEEELQMKLTSEIQRQEEEEELQMKLASEVQRQEEEEEELMMKPDDGSVAQLSEAVEARINAACGNGQQLSADIREPMEQAFGADFNGVHIHTDSEADGLNRQINAKAFTTGHDIFFRDGEYSPSSASGQKLIAHELTHVVQQGNTVTSRKNLEGEPVLSSEGSRWLLGQHETGRLRHSGGYLRAQAIKEAARLPSESVVQRDVPTEDELIASWTTAGVRPEFPPIWALLMEHATARRLISWERFQEVMNNQSEAQRLFGRAMDQAWGQVRDHFLTYLIGSVATATVGAVLVVLPAAQTIIDESLWRRDESFRIQQIYNWLLRQLALSCVSAERTSLVTQWDSRVQAIFNMLVTQTVNYQRWIQGPEAGEFRRRAAAARGGQPTIESL